MINAEKIICKLSEADRRGDLLIEMMDKYKVNGLRELSEEQVVGFWEELKNKNELQN